LDEWFIVFVLVRVQESERYTEEGR
jgi:hypothetical protein